MGSELGDIRRVRTRVLEIAYHEHGAVDGPAVVLLHGFPYDPLAYNAMTAPLAADGWRVIVPYLRGYGPTRFLSEATLRSGQQAALAQDLLDLLDALRIGRAALVGYDWGGRAACIVAALSPERVRCLVTGNGYNLQNIPASRRPASPEAEHRLWYQYYLHTPRGRAGLEADRDAFCRLLWKLWSPTWAFTDAEFTASAASFDNPDFVDVVVQSYRHRYFYADGDPALQEMERALESQPRIGVPAIALWGGDDGVGPPSAEDRDIGRFISRYERRILPGVGHNIPQEAPAATLAALRDLAAG
jgi:pimeloyl-ACP methyl ester carboxylesterase